MNDRRPVLTEDHGDLLISAAGKTLAAALIRGDISYPDPTGIGHPLSSPGASFVTYEHRGALVGCIGSLERELPLVVDVSRNALLAAFADPRTEGIAAVPLDETSMKIAVLEEPETLEAPDFESLTRAVRPGEDGLIVESGDRRATLLPAVWEKIGSVVEFLDVLWAKAELPPRIYGPELRVRRYATVEFAHPDVGALVRESLASI